MPAILLLATSSVTHVAQHMMRIALFPKGMLILSDDVRITDCHLLAACCCTVHSHTSASHTEPPHITLQPMEAVAMG